MEIPEITSPEKPAKAKRTFARAFAEGSKTLYFNTSEEFQADIEMATNHGVFDPGDSIGDAIRKACSLAVLYQTKPESTQASESCLSFEQQFRLLLEQYLPESTISKLEAETGGLSLVNLFVNIGVIWLCRQPCDLKSVQLDGKQKTEEFITNKKK